MPETCKKVVFTAFIVDSHFSITKNVIASTEYDGEETYVGRNETGDSAVKAFENVSAIAIHTS